MVMVEVRQGTLGVDGCGWGPAGNAVDRRSQLDEEDEEERTRRRGLGGGGGGRRQAEEGRTQEATDIKSNNPHLAGGEKYVSNAF